MTILRFPIQFQSPNKQYTACARIHQVLSPAGPCASTTVTDSGNKILIIESRSLKRRRTIQRLVSRVVSLNLQVSGQSDSVASMGILVSQLSIDGDEHWETCADDGHIYLSHGRESKNHELFFSASSQCMISTLYSFGRLTCKVSNLPSVEVAESDCADYTCYARSVKGWC